MQKGDFLYRQYLGILKEELRPAMGCTENAIAILPGSICDGARPSCAAKIASAVEAGILGYLCIWRANSFTAATAL